MEDVEKVLQAIAGLQSEIREFKIDMHEFKNEMYEFKNEMYEFKNEMYEFKNEMYDRFDQLEKKVDQIQVQVAHNTETEVLLREVQDTVKEHHTDIKLLKKVIAN
ncbi:hypothetical protein [Brevibacillus massiliensis]|uniref:hypothetical protein n=1 Tax=Brevibacillus massiliensis TaxID=1118054 RepID=UPI0002DCDA38|nr:hypothetical protein [Brevibacillus massiliensis]